MITSAINMEIKLMVDCENCGNCFDLRSDTDLDDEGDILKEAIHDGNWQERHEKFSITATCPECGVDIKAGPIIW